MKNRKFKQKHDKDLKLKEFEALAKEHYSKFTDSKSTLLFISSNLMNIGDESIRSLIRLIKPDRKAKNYKDLLYVMFWVLSDYIDYTKYDQLKLKDMMQYIFPNLTQINETLKDLKLRMVKSKNHDHHSKSFEITNIFVFESYLYCLKRLMHDYINNGK